MYQEVTSNGMIVGIKKKPILDHTIDYETKRKNVIKHVKGPTSLKISEVPDILITDMISDGSGSIYTVKLPASYIDDKECKVKCMNTGGVYINGCIDTKNIDTLYVGFKESVSLNYDSTTKIWYNINY